MPKYISRRPGKNNYLFRSVIPLSLRPSIGSRQFTISLETSNQIDAARLAEHLNIIVQQIYLSVAEGVIEAPSISQLRQKMKEELALQQHLLGLKVVRRFKFTEEVYLQKLIDDYHQYRIKIKISPSKIYAFLKAAQHLLDSAGNLPLHDVGHQHARQLLAYMDEIKIRRKNQTKTLNQETVRSYYKQIQTMFNWAVGQGYVENNPFANKLASPKIKKARIGRFDEEEMQLILGAELERQEPDRKWLVLIAAYTGARLSEIAQLTKTDISTQGHLVKISINNNNQKRIKNNSSIREIPAHIRLLRLGFKEWVEEKEANLFQKPARNFGAWFNNTYLPLLEIEDKSFHWLRHTVISILTDKRVPLPFIAQLAGHSTGHLTYDTYAAETQPELLLTECVNQIEYRTSHPLFSPSSQLT